MAGFSLGETGGRACGRTAGRPAPCPRWPRRGLPVTSDGAGSGTVPREPVRGRPEPGTTRWPPGPGVPTAAAGHPTTTADGRPGIPRRTVRGPRTGPAGTQAGRAGPPRPPRGVLLRHQRRGRGQFPAGQVGAVTGAVLAAGSLAGAAAQAAYRLGQVGRHRSADRGHKPPAAVVRLPIVIAHRARGHAVNTCHRAAVSPDAPRSGGGTGADP